MSALRSVVLAAVFAAAGCGPSVLDVGVDPDIVWWTDHESGDVSDWTAGGPEAGSTWAPSGEAVVTTDQARSGQYGFRATITTVGMGTVSAAIATRTGLGPEPLYYSAWFLVPAAPTHAVGSYWLCFKLRSRTIATDVNSAVDLWDVKLEPHASGGLKAVLYHHDGGDQPEVAAPEIALGRWVQIEALFLPAPDATGRVALWIDGVLVAEVSGRATAPTGIVEWSVGSIAEELTPATAVLYVDDAAISRRRLGPETPEFTRAR